VKKKKIKREIKILQVSIPQPQPFSVFFFVRAPFTRANLTSNKSNSVAL